MGFIEIDDDDICRVNVSRSLYEEIFIPLFKRLFPDNPYTDHFENAVFRVAPFYWGDCTCGFDEKEWRCDEANPHHINCWSERFERAAQANSRDFHAQQKWAADNGWPTIDGKLKPGVAVYCDCGKAEERKAWRLDNKHDSKCPIAIPNFIYKPTNFMATWYKYPFRGAMANRELSAAELVKIVQHCMESVRG